MGLSAAALIGRLGEACKRAVGAELTVHVKAKANDGGQQMDEIISVLKESDSEPLVGVLTKVMIRVSAVDVWQIASHYTIL